MSAPAKIDSFIGEWAFLSNFHICPMNYEEQSYASVEHAYQAAKTFDHEKRKVFTFDFNPRLTANQAKRIGYNLKPLRPDWEFVKVSIMRELLFQKFNHGILRSQLLSTGNAELVEGNWWEDREWGICYGGQPDGFIGRKCRLWPHDPAGKNHLGRLLMEVRARGKS